MRDPASEWISAAVGLLLFLLMALLLAGMATDASAQTCSFTISDISFGSVSPVAGAATVDSTGTLSIDCSGLAPLHVPATIGICPNLDAGTGGSNSSSRLLAGPTTTIPYQLYSDSSRSTPWGSAALLNFTSVPTIFATSDSSGVIHTSKTIYARMTNTGTAPSGTYSSTFAGQSFYWGLTVVSCGVATVGTLVTPPSFQVSVGVPVDCLLSASGLDFGTKGLLTAAATAQATITVRCTSGAPYSIALGPGGTGTGPTARKMTRTGGGSITYGLYKDSSFTQPWGDAAAGAGTVVSGTGTGLGQNLKVYGQVPVQTTPAPGSYADAVVITLTY